MTDTEADKLIAILKAGYPRQAVTQETVLLYTEMLRDLDGRDALRAVREHIASSPYFPAISEIRSKVARARVDAQPAELAWEGVLAAVSRDGRYKQPKLPPVSAAAVDAVGWEAICNSELIGVERAAFIRAYNAVMERELREANVGALEGREYKRLGEPAKVADVLPMRREP